MWRSSVEIPSFPFWYGLLRYDPCPVYRVCAGTGPRRWSHFPTEWLPRDPAHSVDLIPLRIQSRGFWNKALYVPIGCSQENRESCLTNPDLLLVDEGRIRTREEEWDEKGFKREMKQRENVKKMNAKQRHRKKSRNPFGSWYCWFKAKSMLQGVRVGS